MIKTFQEYKNKKSFLLELLAISLTIIIWIRQTYQHLTLLMETREADAYSRLFHIVHLPLSNVWLPGFQYLMRFFLLIKNSDNFTNYRLGIYLYTIALSLVIFLIIKNITKKILPSLIGLILFLFHPLTQQLSTITLTEIPWLFYLYLSIYLFFFTKHKYKIYLSLISFTVSETLRYESWFLLPIIIPYLILFCKKKYFDSIKFIFLIIIFPVIWMIILNHYFDNPISFIFEKLKCSQHANQLIHWKIENLMDFINLQLDIYIFPHLYLYLFLFIGIFYKKIKSQSISVISLFLFLCFFIETLINFNENTTPRFFYYLIPPLSVIIPATANNIFQKYPKLFRIFFYIPFYLIFSYQSLSKLNQTYYKTINITDILDIENVLQRINLFKIKTTYLCTDGQDYLFSNFLLYRLQYKNISIDCSQNLYPQNKSSLMVISPQDENFYDSKIIYSTKEKLSNHILYSF